MISIGMVQERQEGSFRKGRTGQASLYAPEGRKFFQNPFRHPDYYSLRCPGYLFRRQLLHHRREKGDIRYKFNPETGEIVLGQQVKYEPVEEFKRIPQPVKKNQPEKVEEIVKSTKKNFCPYCGQAISEGANFCENCGSQL